MGRLEDPGGALIVSHRPGQGGVGWGAIISATGGVHTGGQQYRTDGGGVANGWRAIGNHGKTGYRGGMLLESVASESFGDVPVNEK